MERSPMENMKRPFKDPEPRKRWYNEREIAVLWHAAGCLGHYEGAFLRMMILDREAKAGDSVLAIRGDFETRSFCRPSAGSVLCSRNRRIDSPNYPCPGEINLCRPVEGVGQAAL